MAILQKPVIYGGRSVHIVCDGRCNKAWGVNKRPRLYYQEPDWPPRELRENEEPRDADDVLFIGDDELGDAPRNPGTYEGGHGKPSGMPITNTNLMNKWCARECERSDIIETGEPIKAKDWSKSKPNRSARQPV